MSHFQQTMKKPRYNEGKSKAAYLVADMRWVIEQLLEDCIMEALRVE